MGTVDPRWRKSSHSAGNGGDCVEVGAVPWRKSSHSGGNGGDCVEAGTRPGAVLVRDTKNRDGAVLTVPAAAWRTFAAAVKAR